MNSLAATPLTPYVTPDVGINRNLRSDENDTPAMTPNTTNTTVSSNSHFSHHNHRPTPYAKPSRVAKRPLDVLPDSLNIDATIAKMDSLYNTQFYLWIKNPQNREYAALRVRPLVQEYNNLSHTAHVLRWIASDWKPSEAKDLFRLVTEKWDEGKRRLLAFYLVKAQREEEGLLVKKRRKVVPMNTSWDPSQVISEASSSGNSDSNSTSRRNVVLSAPTTPTAHRRTFDAPSSASSPPYSPESPRWRLATDFLTNSVGNDSHSYSLPSTQHYCNEISPSSTQYSSSSSSQYSSTPQPRHYPDSSAGSNYISFSTSYTPTSPAYSPASPEYRPRIAPFSPAYSTELSPPYSPDTPPHLQHLTNSVSRNNNNTSAENNNSGPTYQRQHRSSHTNSPSLSERKVACSPVSASPVVAPHRIALDNHHRLSQSDDMLIDDRL